MATSPTAADSALTTATMELVLTQLQACLEEATQLLQAVGTLPADLAVQYKISAVRQPSAANRSQLTSSQQQPPTHHSPAIVAAVATYNRSHSVNEQLSAVEIAQLVVERTTELLGSSTGEASALAGIQLSVSRASEKRVAGMLDVVVPSIDASSQQTSRRHVQQRKRQQPQQLRPARISKPLVSINQHDSSTGLRVLELYAGIGGWRLSLPEWLPVTHITAIEINQSAVKTYNHNFHAPSDRGTSNVQSTILPHLIEQLPPDTFQADIWCMSPPCQPYTITNNALSLDDSDNRNDSFKYVMSVLQQMEAEHRPMHILLENVTAFGTSAMHEQWCQTLTVTGYTYAEYSVSPAQIGVPNSRSRYYCIAEKSQRFADESGIHLKPPLQLPESSDTNASPAVDMASLHPYLQKQLQHADTPLQPLHKYLNHNMTPRERESLLVPLSTLQKDYAANLSLVSPCDVVSHCFTGFYGGRYDRSVGSLLLEGCTTDLLTHPLDRLDMTQYYGKVRRFAPSEMLALMGFPARYSFPADIRPAAVYKLIGNSVNVSVLKRLTHHLFDQYKPNSTSSDTS